MSAPQLRVVPVAGGPVVIEPTSNPALFFVHSRTKDGLKYRVGGIGGATPWCTCPARVQCAHITAVLSHVLEKQMTDSEPVVGELMPAETPASLPSAVVPLRPAATTSVAARQAGAASAQTMLLTARGSIEGYREYLYLAEELVKGGIVPQGAKPQAVAAMMLKASELGVPPMAALELFYVVGNKVAIQGQMVAALIERSGRGYIEIIESTDMRATVIGHREGRPPMTVTWTREMATTAGSKAMGGWADKLVWKAIARIGRRMFADVLGGMDVSDGDGVVIDYGSVPEQQGEYLPPVVEQPTPMPAPETDPPYAWTEAMKAALKDRPIPGADLYDYLGVGQYDSKEARGRALKVVIDRWLSCQDDRTPLALISTVADWIANNRPAVPEAVLFPQPAPQPFAVVEPSGDSGQFDEPTEADSLFDLGEYTEISPTTDARGNH